MTERVDRLLAAAAARIPPGDLIAALEAAMPEFNADEARRTMMSAVRAITFYEEPDAYSLLTVAVLVGIALGRELERMESSNPAKEGYV